MTRKALNDCRWFDMDKAAKLGSSRGQSDFRWCDLYRTASGTYVLGNITCWQGERDSFEAITPDDASEFLIRYGYDLPKELEATAASHEV